MSPTSLQELSSRKIFRKKLQEKSSGNIFRNYILELSAGKIFRKKSSIELIVNKGENEVVFKPSNFDVIFIVEFI